MELFNYREINTIQLIYKHIKLNQYISIFFEESDSYQYSYRELLK